MNQVLTVVAVVLSVRGQLVLTINNLLEQAVILIYVILLFVLHKDLVRPPARRLVIPRVRQVVVCVEIDHGLLI